MTTLELIQELLDDIKINGVRDVEYAPYADSQPEELCCVVHAQEGCFITPMN